MIREKQGHDWIACDIASDTVLKVASAGRGKGYRVFVNFARTRNRVHGLENAQRQAEADMVTYAQQPEEAES
jgi:hypothetical protein